MSHQCRKSVFQRPWQFLRKGLREFDGITKIRRMMQRTANGRVTRSDPPILATPAHVLGEFDHWRADVKPRQTRAELPAWKSTSPRRDPSLGTNRLSLKWFVFAQSRVVFATSNLACVTSNPTVESDKNGLNFVILRKKLVFLGKRGFPVHLMKPWP